MQGSEAADGTPEDLSVWRASSSWSLAVLSYKSIEIHIDGACHSDWGVGGELSKTSPFQSPVHSGDVGLVIPQTGGSPVENCNM